MFTFCGECSAFNENPGAKALIKTKDARRDPRIRRKQIELIDGVNSVIRDIGVATAQINRLGAALGRSLMRCKESRSPSREITLGRVTTTRERTSARSTT